MVISAGQLLTGPAGVRVAEGAVLVDGGRIAAVGPYREVAPLVSADVPHLRFPGGTLLPGLIDCHVHLALDAGPDVVGALLAADDAGLLLDMASRAQQLLDCGVTTVRDLGDRGGLAVRLREAVAAGRLAGPQILAATVPLTVPGGHCWFFGGEVRGEQAVRERVARNADLGADVIKVMASGGYLTPEGPSLADVQFEPPELAAIVDEAHRRGLPVAAHAHATAAVAASLTAGVDTVEHCTWITESGFDAPADVVAELVARRISVCPAVSRAWHAWPRRFGPEIAEALVARLGWLDEQGVHLAFGTDAGIPGSAFDDVVGALEVFAQAGLSPGRIVEIATVHAAETLGLAGTAGSVAAGLDADLLVVDGDPLHGIDALRHVRLVVTRGRPHVPSAALSRFGTSAAH